MASMQSALQQLQQKVSSMESDKARLVAAAKAKNEQVGHACIHDHDHEFASSASQRRLIARDYPVYPAVRCSTGLIVLNDIQEELGKCAFVCVPHKGICMPHKGTCMPYMRQSAMQWSQQTRMARGRTALSACFSAHLPCCDGIGF